MVILLMIINGYCWLLYYKLLLVIICYITTIGDYCIIMFFLIFYVIMSWAINNYYILGYLKLFFKGYYFLI